MISALQNDERYNISVVASETETPAIAETAITSEQNLSDEKSIVSETPTIAEQNLSEENSNPDADNSEPTA